MIILSCREVVVFQRERLDGLNSKASSVLSELKLASNVGVPLGTSGHHFRQGALTLRFHAMLSIESLISPGQGICADF